MSEETKPKVLVVYYTLTQQAGRVAEALHARVRIVFEPEADGEQTQVAENSAPYGAETNGQG